MYNPALFSIWQESQMAAKKTRKKGSTTRKKAPARKSRPKKTAAKKRTVARKKASTARKKSSRKKPAKKKKVAKKKPARKKVAKKKAKKAKAKKATRKSAKKKKVAKKKASSAAKRKKPAKKKPAARRRAAPKKAARKAPPRRRSKAEVLSGPIHGVEPYRPKRGESYMSAAQLEHFRDILTAWKRELMFEVDRTVHHMQDEAANFPDPNDRATQESEFGLELRTRDRERKLLRKIDSALARIEDGSYGYCEETGEEIGLKRLEARPVATLCLEAQERRELAERQFRDRDDRYR